MPSPLIRAATPEDLDRLTALEHVSFASDRLTARSFRHFLAAPTATLRVAVEAGRVAGYFLLLVRARSSVARLYSIAVDAAARGRGLASALLDDAEAAARSRGANRLALEVRADNSGAIRLYERRGYVLVGRTPDYYEDGAEARRYQKHLSRTGADRPPPMDR